MPRQVSNYVVESYIRLRKLSKDDEAQNKSHTYTSARTLLGILRLAQALARLRWSDFVERPDVDEALRLMECSKESLMDEESVEREVDHSINSQIFRLIKSMAQPRVDEQEQRLGKGPGGERDMDIDPGEEDGAILSMMDIRARVLSAGFTEAQLMETIKVVCIFYIDRSCCLNSLSFSMKTSIHGLALLVDRGWNLYRPYICIPTEYLLLGLINVIFCCVAKIVDPQDLC